jgi:hypothetical protein
MTPILNFILYLLLYLPGSSISLRFISLGGCRRMQAKIHALLCVQAPTQRLHFHLRPAHSDTKKAEVSFRPACIIA